jgi:dihydropteroate synthase
VSSSLFWRTRGVDVPLDRPVIAAILNVTPDSFSDGGLLGTVDEAVRRAEEVVAEGADLLDIGGESTRPGAKRVAADEETRRVIPVLRAIRRRFESVAISIDTTRSDVAAAALSEGANIINDVAGLRLDGSLGPVIASHRAGVVLMHSRGGVEEMATYRHAVYSDDVVSDVVAELGEAVSRATRAGIEESAIVLDPGIGFSKRSEHSLGVLRHLDRVAALGFPVMVGASRKRFIGEITGVTTPAERSHGSVGAHVAALVRGARLFRVHDVRAHRHALDVAWRVLALGHQTS